MANVISSKSSSDEMTPRERFVAAIKREPVDRRPVGNITSSATYEQMRRTGHEWPVAHTDSEEIAGLAELSYTDLGYDTVMPYFGLIHGAAALGAPVEWGEDPFVEQDGKITSGPRMPACKQPPLWSGPDEANIPDDFLDRPEAKSIIDAIRILRKRHPDACVVGKVMGPWTLSYHMFGVQDFLLNIILDPDWVRGCLDVLKDVSVMFANAQFEAGADVLTLADHSTGDLVRADTYRDFLMPVHSEIAPRIDGPVMLHCCGNTLDRMKYIKEAGFDAFHFAYENDPHESKKEVGDFPLVGNVSNIITLMNGDPEAIKEEVKNVYSAGIDVISPECAVPPQVSDASLKMIADTVLEIDAQEKAGIEI